MKPCFLLFTTSSILEINLNTCLLHLWNYLTAQLFFLNAKIYGNEIEHELFQNTHSSGICLERAHYQFQ